MKLFRLSATAAMCLISCPALAEDFGNDSIMALTRAGIGEDVLLAKIGSLPCAYDVSTTSIVALKNAGVADAVIAAMVARCTGSSKAQGAVANVSDPNVMRSPGLYIDLGSNGAHHIEKIRPTIGSGGRATGNGSLLFPFRVKLAIPRASAQTLATSSRPTFYFYFKTNEESAEDFGTSATLSAQSPSEFNLVRFKQKDGQREMVVAKQKAFSSNIGIDPKDALQFTIDELSDGIFSATPTLPLEPGEYGFVLRAGSDAYRIYDFEVR